MILPLAPYQADIRKKLADLQLKQERLARANEARWQALAREHRVARYSAPADGAPPEGLTRRVQEFERRLICAALQRCHGNRTASARGLGITRRILGYKMQQLGIRIEYRYY